MIAAPEPEPAPFASARAQVEQLVGWLDGAEAAMLSHAELESAVQDKGRDLLRQFFQDHLDLRAQREQRIRVVDAAGQQRTRVGAGHQRTLSTVFGQVEVRRRAYRTPGQANLYPADAALNLPAERHSHGLRRLAALEATRGSFDDAAAAITRASGVSLGKRQTEALVAKAAADIDAFYAGIDHEPTGPEDVLVLSCDGKGHRDASRRTAPGHRQSRRQHQQEAVDSAVQRRAAQPQTDRRSRRRLRPRVAATHRRRHPRHQRQTPRQPRGPPANGSPPASPPTPPTSSPGSSTKPNAATPNTSAAG